MCAKGAQYVHCALDTMLGAACVAALLVLFSQIQQSQMSDVDTHISAQSCNGDSHADAAYDYLMMANANNIEAYDYDY